METARGERMFIDARGIGCPKPVIMAEEALLKTDEGTLEIFVDNEASVQNLKRFAAKNGYYAESVKDDQYWKVQIIKGYLCEVQPEEGGPQEPQKELLLIIGSDTMGKEEELGKILMKGFFDTIRVTKEIPHTIFFLNAGVKLTTLDGEIVSVLKELQSMGAEIFTCGTCLKYYGLESELKVGYRGTTNHIVEGMADFKKTVWIS